MKKLVAELETAFDKMLPLDDLEDYAGIVQSVNKLLVEAAENHAALLKVLLEDRAE